MANLLLSLLVAADAALVAKPATPAAPETSVTTADGDAGREAIPPELTSDGLREELQRAARDRQAQVAKLAEQQTKLVDERAQLAQMAKDVDSARRSLHEAAQQTHREGAEHSAPTGAPQAPAAAGAAHPPGHSLELATKTLRGMSPNQAAQVLLRVEPSLAVAVLGRMRPGDSGAILEKMPAERAAQIVAALASPREGQGATATPTAERSHE